MSHLRRGALTVTVLVERSRGRLERLAVVQQEKCPHLVGQELTVAAKGGALQQPDLLTSIIREGAAGGRQPAEQRKQEEDQGRHVPAPRVRLVAEATR